jgi:hypothetical protein
MRSSRRSSCSEGLPTLGLKPDQPPAWEPKALFEGGVRLRRTDDAAQGSLLEDITVAERTMFGPQFGFGNMVFGSLGIVFGLSWWSTLTAVTIGVALAR